LTGTEGLPEPTSVDVEPECVAIKPEVNTQLALIEPYAEHRPPPIHDYYARFRLSDVSQKAATTQNGGRIELGRGDELTI
jgi:hypothetical protein